MLSVDSSSCRKKSYYCFEKILSTSHTEQSHVKKIKYILGVNRKTTNIAVMSELGRYPIYYYLMLIYVIKSYILVKSIHGIRVYYILLID